MAEGEEGYLRECEAKGVCPTCQAPLSSRIGSGRVADGVFCSLTCFAQWHQTRLIERHKEKLKKDDRDG